MKHMRNRAAQPCFIRNKDIGRWSEIKRKK